MQQISDDQLARLEQAAGEGDVSIQYLLGQMFENGLGVPQNLDKAAKFYQKAADANHVLAQNALGWMYAEGRGVEKIDAEAVKWWNKAAAQNDLRALTYVRGTQSPISASDLHDFVKGSMLNSIKDEVSKWAFRNVTIAVTILGIAGALGIGYTLREARFAISLEMIGKAEEIDVIIETAQEEVDVIIETAQHALATIRIMTQEAEASFEEAEASLKKTQLLAEQSQILSDKILSDERVSYSETERLAPDKSRENVE